MQQQHGSGKTTVLVGRIINKILKGEADIDELLIVTFTNAAASEIKERVLESIYQKIEENPNNVNLQRQVMLLNKANISTIHSFCLEIIRNYFYEIGISSNFKIGDTSEIELLKQETVEEVFESLYEEGNEGFIKLVNIYGGYIDDERLKNIILKIYNYSQTMPFAEEWVEKNVEKFNLQDKLNLDFSKTIWGEELIRYFKDEIDLCIDELEKASIELGAELSLKDYYSIILQDISQLKDLIREENTWDDIYKKITTIKFIEWKRQGKTNCKLKTKCKKIRDDVKKIVDNMTKKVFLCPSKQANEDIYSMYKILRSIGSIILKFSKKYQENKREKNIIDFNDIEHYALNILVNKNDKGEYKPSNIANIYKKKFVEIAIDEYQDSSLVQEYILNTISNNNNIFMVGDVKQSIYKFRQARPELFLEKYYKYILSDNEEKICNEDTKIQLCKNFRSRKNILNVINTLFDNIMSEKLGDINYDEEEYLNYGANYKENINMLEEVELDIIDLSENEKEENNNEYEDRQLLEKTEIEAKFVAKKVKELVNSNYYIYDRKEGYRKVTYKDIVILLRTTLNISQIYERELNNLELPVFNDANSNYFETEEIQVVLSVLKIIDNPNSDIPLVTVLKSPIGKFTDNELIEIRLNAKDTSYYEALCRIKEDYCNVDLREKVIKFLDMLNIWQLKEEYLGLDELIWYIYESTSYYDIVHSNKYGKLKTANLRFLLEKARDYEKVSFKGLYNFINYIDKINKSSGDIGSAKIIGENEDVIRIMSIHKSKGLEFPIVFLCSIEKQFNLQDLNGNILLHQDMGFGPKIINYERSIEYTTLAREALREISLKEMVSEEMRLLYVALTRAKEKLIIVGCDKDLEKSLSKYDNMILKTEQNGINISAIRRGKSYLDWLELVYVKEQKKLESILKFKIYDKYMVKSEIKGIEKNEEREIINLNNIKESKMKKINEILNWEYKYKLSTEMEGKISVTDIVRGNKSVDNEMVSSPKFLSGNKKLNNADIGTLIHLIMERLDFKKTYDKRSIEKLIDELVIMNIITQNEVNYINIDKILKFTKSDIYCELKEAKQIYKETPFYLYIMANEIYKNAVKEKVLVQGIIDLYYINKENELVLVDYKTDYVKEGNEIELINKYRQQLDIYKKALERSIKKKVKTVYIYSLCLNKKILL